MPGELDVAEHSVIDLDRGLILWLFLDRFKLLKEFEVKQVDWFRNFNFFEGVSCQ